jgi:hypothetical protein
MDYEVESGFLDSRTGFHFTQRRIPSRIKTACRRGGRDKTTITIYVTRSLQGGGPHKTNTLPNSSNNYSDNKTMKPAAALLLLAAAPVLAQTAVPLSESPISAKPSTSSLRGAASSRATSSSSSSSSSSALSELPTEDSAAAAARDLQQQLHPDQGCYYNYGLGNIQNVTCTQTLLGQCSELMANDCASSQQQAIEYGASECQHFTVWLENSSSCDWAFVCCDDPFSD